MVSMEVIATFDSFFEDTSQLHPLEKYDSIMGTVGDHDFTVKYSPHEYEEYNEIFGEFRLSVFASDRNPNGGGTIIYTERHVKPDSNTPLRDLFVRARKNARDIDMNDNLHKCKYCHALTDDENSFTRSLSLIWGGKFGTFIPSRSEKQCAFITSWLPPKVEIRPHNSDENLLYSKRELDNCETLRMTTGYPEWPSRTQLQKTTAMRLFGLVDLDKDVFEGEIDKETLKSLLDYLDYDEDLPRTRIIDTSKLTWVEEGT